MRNFILAAAVLLTTCLAAHAERFPVPLRAKAKFKTHVKTIQASADWTLPAPKSNARLTVHYELKNNGTEPLKVKFQIQFLDRAQTVSTAGQFDPPEFVLAPQKSRSGDYPTPFAGEERLKDVDSIQFVLIVVEP